MAKRNRVPDNVDLRIRLRFGEHALLGDLFHFQRHHVGCGLVARRDPPEIFLRHLRGLVRVKVADQNRREILRLIVQRVKVVRLLLGDRGNVRRPAQHRPGVGMRFPDHRVEGLGEFSERRRFGPHPPFLKHHVPLGVEFTENRMQQAFRLHPHPEFKLVGGNHDEIAGHVLGGEGVHARTAGRGVNPVKLILHQNLPLILDQLLELALQLAPAGRHILELGRIIDVSATIGLTHLALFLPHQIANAFLVGNNLEVALIILGANRRGPLEHHVLKKMSHAGDAGALVGTAHARHPAARHGRLALAFHDEQLHAVGECLLGNGQLLGVR